MFADLLSAQGIEYNFGKQGINEVELADVGYDYDSLMHYGASDFAIQGYRVITPLKAGGENIGWKEQLSDKDTQKVSVSVSVPSSA